MTAHDSGWKWWLAFSLLPDSHRLHWHQLAWRTQWLSLMVKCENSLQSVNLTMPADRDDPPAGAEGHHDGPGSGGHYPPQAPEDRRRRHTQHPPRPPPSLQRLPVPGPGPSHGSQAQAGITDPFALPTQTHKRRRRLPARAPLAQNRPKQAKTGNGTDNHQPESPASLKSANRKSRDPAFASKNPTLEPFVTNPA